MRDRLEELRELIALMGPRDNSRAWQLVLDELEFLRSEIARLANEAYERENWAR